MRGKQVKEWGEGLKQGHKEAEQELKIQKLHTEIDQRNKTVKMLMALIEKYGFCREEMQLARMDLKEAHEKWMGEVDIDGKNLGAFSHWVLQEMKRNGEL